MRTPKQLPEVDDWEFKSLTKGRKQEAVYQYQGRVGCTPEEAEGVINHWYKIAFPNS